MGILTKRFQDWIEQNNLLSEFQAGFRANYSTADHIFILSTVAMNFIRLRKKLYVFFVDLKAAFDAVDRNALFYKLCNRGLSRKFLSFMITLYERTSSAVWDGKQLSNFFDTTTGVKQGCNFSPLAFAMYIDDITEVLPGGISIGGVCIKVLLYADDLVLLADSPESLQRMINRLQKYCEDWRLSVNVSKSKAMIFRGGGGRYARGESWMFNGQEVEIVKTYKYLGINITSNMNMEHHLKERLTTAKIAISAAWKNCLEDKNITLRIKYLVFQAVAKSILLYGAQAWGYKSYETVEKLLRYFLKRIFRLPQCTPNNMLFVETGLPPLYIDTLKLHFDYILKSLAMGEERLTKRIAMYVIEAKILWFDEWQKLAEFCGHTFTLNLNNVFRWKEELYNLLKVLADKLHADSIEHVESSVHREIYARLNHRLGDKNYFNDKYTADMISTIFKVRGEIMFLNYMPHREDLPIYCTLCNLRKRENVYHFLGTCPILGEFRQQYFGKRILEESEMAGILNGADWVQLYKYCERASKYRRAIIEEAF